VDVADTALDSVFESLETYSSSWPAYDDVDAALEMVARAGLVTTVLTNGTTAQQAGQLTRIGPAGRVGPVWTVEDPGVAKPSPDAFVLACRRWGLPPSGVLSVGGRLMWA
jgi:putative hydrolase of the HAD superfamily